MSALPSRESSAGSRAPIPALTGFRIVAAAWVLGFHLIYSLTRAFPRWAPLERLLESGFLAVDAFFVLSGYLLAHNHAVRFARGEGPGVGRFYWMRLSRIYPVHAFTLAVLVLGWLSARGLGFERFANLPNWRLEELPAQLLLAHAWGFSQPAWNLVSWSISCEWLGYLAFPLLAPLGQRVRDGRVALVAGLALHAAALAVTAQLGERGLDATYRGAVLRFSGGFLAGILYQRAAEALEHLPYGRDGAALAALVAVLTLAGAFGPSVPLAVLAGLSVLLVARSKGVVVRVLGGRAFVHGGEVSYALYMTHAIVLLVVFSLWPIPEVSAPLAARAWYFARLLGLVAAAALATHHWVEEPARAWLHARLRPRARKQSAPSA